VSKPPIALICIGFLAVYSFYLLRDKENVSWDKTGKTYDERVEADILLNMLSDDKESHAHPWTDEDKKHVCAWVRDRHHEGLAQWLQGFEKRVNP
jgi:hypothetical protein